MVIALCVLAVVLLTMMGMFLISRTALFAKEDETAYALALLCLERYETIPFADIDDTHINNLGDLGIDTQGYTVQARVTNQTVYMKEVEVTVSWESAIGRPQSVPVTLTRQLSAAGHKNVGDLN
jgi:hypothetical protein